MEIAEKGRCSFKQDDAMARREGTDFIGHSLSYLVDLMARSCSLLTKARRILEDLPMQMQSSEAFPA